MRVEISSKTSDDKNKSFQEIILTYMSHFDSGYDLTMNEISDLLDCTIRYIQKHYKEEISYINVNTFVKSALKTIDKKTNLPIYEVIFNQLNSDDEYRYTSLFKKRLLFSRPEFVNYLKNNLQIEQRTKAFIVEDFRSIKSIDKVLANRKKYKELLNQKKFSLHDVLKYAISKYIDTDFADFEEKQLKVAGEYVTVHIPKPVIYKFDQVDELPESFIGLQTVKVQMNYNHDIEAYRDLERLGIRKYRLGTLARFDPNEWEWKKFNQPCVTMSFSKYIKLSRSMNDIEIMQHIINAAISLLD